jgi:hypothetical protein
LASCDLDGSIKIDSTITLLGKNIKIHFLNKLNLLRKKKALLLMLNTSPQ